MLGKRGELRRRQLNVMHAHLTGPVPEWKIISDTNHKTRRSLIRLGLLRRVRKMYCAKAQWCYELTAAGMKITKEWDAATRFAWRVQALKSVWEVCCK